MPETSRGRLLSRAAIVAPAVALPTAALALSSGIDPHPARALEASSLMDRIYTDDESDPKAHERRTGPLYDRVSALERSIAYTPARTAAGAREQVLLALRALEVVAMGDLERAALGNAAATLERLAGEAAA